MNIGPLTHLVDLVMNENNIDLGRLLGKEKTDELVIQLINEYNEFASEQLQAIETRNTRKR